MRPFITSVIAASTADSVLNHPTLPTNLVSYWKLYDNATDFRGSSNGTVYGTTFDGTKATFDGDDDYIDSNTVPNASAGSINFWFNAPAQSDTYGCLVGIYTDASQLRNYIAIQASDGQLQMGFDANVEFTGDIVNDSTWRMATMTWGDGTNLARIYLNGVLTHTLADDEVHTFVLDWYFGNVNVAGSPTADRYLKGNMKDVGYWSISITTSEIADLYNGGEGLPYST